MKHKLHIFHFLIIILSPFILKAQDLPSVCGGSKIRYGVKGSPGSVINWQVNGGVITDNYNDSVDVQWNSIPGIHTISYTETNTFGCSGLPGKGNVMVVVPDINLGNFINICEGQTATLDAGEFVSYLWYNGLTSRILDFSSPGTYWVEARDNLGCLARDTFEIVVNDLPVVNLGRDTMICAPNELLLDVGALGTSYVWSNNTSGPTYYAKEGDNIIWVKVTDSNNCLGSDTINILSCNIAFVVPNAFTPGGGDKNEVFRLDKVREVHPQLSVKIYDRWGRMVFSSPATYPTPWDGTYKGKPLPMDTYYYIITPGDGSKDIYGSVTIIR